MNIKWHNEQIPKMNVKNNKDVTFLTYPAYEEMNWLVHGFSTRLGGVSRGIYTSMNLSFTRGDEESCVKENYRSMIQGMYGLPVTKEAIIYPAPSAQQKLLKDYRYADKNTVYLGMQGTASSFLTDVNKILKELYTGEYTVEKTAEEIDQAWDREAQEE